MIYRSRFISGFEKMSKFIFAVFPCKWFIRSNRLVNPDKGKCSNDFGENCCIQRAHSLYIWSFKGVVISLDLRGISTRLVTVGHSAKSPKSSVLTPNWILIPFYLICFVNIHHHVPSLRHFWTKWFFHKNTVNE